MSVVSLVFEKKLYIVRKKIHVMYVKKVVCTRHTICNSNNNN